MIYAPEEDSYLLSEVLKKFVKNKNISVLDMGSGSGILAKTLINLGIAPENITLVDINREAIQYLKKIFPDSKVIHSNLFSNIHEKFDLIVFNPPYLPKNKYDQGEDTTGGKKGGEIINKFLNKAKDYLNKQGKIFLLISSLTKSINFKEAQIKILKTKKLFFEELYVLQIEYGHRKETNNLPQNSINFNSCSCSS